MTITEFRGAVINLCINSGYPNNADEIKFATASVSFSNDGLIFSASTSRKISEGHHNTFHVSHNNIDECLRIFEKTIKVNASENDIELK